MSHCGCSLWALHLSKQFTNDVTRLLGVITSHNNENIYFHSDDSGSVSVAGGLQHAKARIAIADSRQDCD